MAEKQEKKATLQSVDNSSSSSSVQVHIRLKQTSKNEKGNYHIFADGTQLYIPNRQKRLELDKWYRFDHVYPPFSSNQQVYNGSGYKLVESTLHGQNTALFAYGQSGSGKNETLMSEDGIITHLVSHLFDRISGDVTRRYKILFSYVQIYNEHIYDLLNPDNPTDHSVREDFTRLPYVENMTWLPCESPLDVYELIDIGQKVLISSEAEMNRHLNASHTIFQLKIERSKGIPGVHTRQLQETKPCVPLARKESVVPEIYVDEVAEDDQVDVEDNTFIRGRLRERHSIAIATINEGNIINSPGISSTKSRLAIPLSKESKEGLHIFLKRRQSLQDETLPSHSDRLAETPYSLNRSSREKRMAFQQARSVFNKSSMGKHFDQIPENDELTQPENRQQLSHSFDISNVTRQGTDSIPDSSRLYTLLPTQCETSTEYDDVIDDTRTKKKRDNNSIINKEEIFESSEDEPRDDDLVNTKISIINLASSERLNGSCPDKRRLREAQSINVSLLELGNVISAVANGDNKKHVPYRNSVMTHMLEDSLQCNCAAMFLICCSGRDKETSETRSALEFGQRLKKDLSTLLQNTDVDYKAKCEYLAMVSEEQEKIHYDRMKEYQTRLENCESEEKGRKKAILHRQAEIHSTKIELDKTLIQCEKSNEDLKKLKDKISVKEDRMTLKDRELSQLQHNTNSVLDQLAAGSTKHKDLDNIPTFNASTNTPDMEFKDITFQKHNTIHMRETEEEIVGTSTTPTDTVSCDVVKEHRAISNTLTPILSQNIARGDGFVHKTDAATNTSLDVQSVKIETCDAVTNTPMDENFKIPLKGKITNVASNTDVIFHTDTHLHKDPSDAPRGVPHGVIVGKKLATDTSVRKNASLDETSLLYSILKEIESLNISGHGPLKEMCIKENLLTITTSSSLNQNVYKMRSAIITELLELHKLCNQAEMRNDEMSMKYRSFDEVVRKNEMLPEDVSSVLTDGNAEDENVLPNEVEKKGGEEGEEGRGGRRGGRGRGGGRGEEEEGIITRQTSIFSDIFDILRKQKLNMLNSVNGNDGIKRGGIVDNTKKESDEINIESREATSDTNSNISESQFVVLQNYLENRKNSNDTEKTKLAIKFFSDIDGKNQNKIEENKFYEKLIEVISTGNPSLPQNVETFQQMLGILRSDHMLTACLLSLKYLKKCCYKVPDAIVKNMEGINNAAPSSDEVTRSNPITHNDHLAGYKGPNISYKVVYRSSSLVRQGGSQRNNTMGVDSNQNNLQQQQ